MAKGTKTGGKGPRKGPGWKFVDTDAFQGPTKEAYRAYLTHWKSLIDALEKEWNEKFPDGKDGLFIEFKTENDALKYLLKGKRKAQQSRGDDVFGNPVGRSEQGHSGAPEASPVVAITEGLEDELKELDRPLLKPNRFKMARRT